MVKRRFAYLVSAFLALSCTFGALAAPGDPAIIVARLSGTVEVSHPKQTTGKWQAAKQGQSIGLGWKLRTGKGGKVQLTFPKNNTVILKENSVLYVDKLDAGGGGKLLTDKGGLLVQLKNALTPGSKFEVDTPAALATVRGTEFAVSMSPEGGRANVVTFEGNVSLSERPDHTKDSDASAGKGGKDTADRSANSDPDAEGGQLALETIEIAHEGLKMQPGGAGSRTGATGAPKKSFAQKLGGAAKAGDAYEQQADSVADKQILKKEEGGRHTPFHNKYTAGKGLPPSGFVPRPMSFNLVQIGDLDQDGLDDFLVQFTSGPRQTATPDNTRFGSGPRQSTSMDGSLDSDRERAASSESIELAADLDGDGENEAIEGIALGDLDGDGEIDYAVTSRLHGKNSQPTRVMALDSDAVAAAVTVDAAGYKDSLDSHPHKRPGASRGAAGGDEGDPLKEEAHFKEVTGLDVYIDTLEVQEGGVNTGAHKRPGGVQVATGDLNGDGAPEALELISVNDLDGDGVADLLVTPASNGAEIRNPGRANGGIASRFGALSDADGDGAVDALDPDSDGDGMIDLAVGDINGDGVIDHAFPHADVDGDGLVDLVVLTGFSNGEIPNQERKAAHDIAMNAIRNMRGFAEQPTVGDLDGDGRADLVVGDFDGDGHADLIDLSGSGLDSKGKTEWITAIGLPKITPKIAKESHGKFRTIPDLDGDGSPEEIATGGAQDVATGGELVLPESLTNEIKQQVAAKKMMGAPKIGEASARANDRLRNAGPVNDWPSILEDGSFEQLLAEEFLRKGASTRDSDGLVFNVVNPRAARDNHLQGAVDVLGRTLATDTDQDGLPDYLDADDDGDAIDDAEDEDVDGSGSPDARELKMWLDKNADGNIGAGELTDLEAGFRLDGSRSTDDGEVSKLAKVHGLHRGHKSRTYQDQPDSDRAGKLHPKLYQESVDPFSGAGAQGERTKETHKLDLKLYGYESTVEVRNEQGTQLLGEGQTIDVEEGSAPTPPYPSGPDAAQFRQELKDQFKDGDIPDQNDFADTIDSLVIDGDEKVAVLFNPREYNLRLQQLVEQAKVLESLAHEAAHVVQQRSGRAAGEVKHDHVYQHNQTDLEFARQQLAPILSGLSEITDAATALLAEEITTLGLNPASKNLEHNKLSESQGRLGPANGGVERPGDGDSAAGILIGLLEEIEAALGTIRVADSNASSGNLVRAADSKDSGNNENWDFGSRLQFLEQGGVVIVLDGVDLEALTAHCDQWSELLNTLGRIKVEISAAGYDSGEDIAATSSTSGILPSPMGGLAERRFKWMAPENLGQFQGQVGQQLGELENMRQRINELEAKLQNLGLLARTAGGETTAPTDLGAEELARAQDDLQRTGSIVQLQLRSLRNLAEAELAYVTGVDPARLDELGSSTSSTQRAQDHNSSRSNKTASGIATDGSGGDDDDDGDGRAQDHNSSRSNKTASGIATDESGGDDDDDGDGRAQDHNSSRSNKTANGMATDGSGGEDDDDGDGRAQDHNSSRSNKTASSQPEIIDNTKGQLLRFFSDLIALLGDESDSGEISVPPIAPDPSNEGLKEHLDLWADCGRSSRSLQAQLEQLVIAGRGGETGRPEFDTAPYESSLGAIESQLADSEQAGSAQVIEIIARITTLNEAADALLTTRDDFLTALREYANTYALYSLQKGARQQSDGADTPSGKNIGLLISEVKGQSDVANNFMEQVKLIVPIAMEKELRARRNQENDTQDVGDTSNKDYATDPYVETSQRYASDPYSEDLLRLVQHFVGVLDRLAALDAQFGQYQAQVEVRGWDPKTKQAIVGSANKFERISQEWERYETHEQTTQLKFLWVQVLELHEELHDIYEDFGDAVGLKVKEKANRTKCSSNLRTLPPVGFDTAQGELLPANIELPAVQNELLPAVQSELLPAVQEWVEAVVENDAQLRALHERMEEMQDDIDPLISSNEELQDQLRGLIDPGDPVLGTRFENMDTDNDGLSDVAEIALGLDPLASNDDGFIELVEPEDGERIPADTDMVSFAFEPLDTDQQVDYRLVLEGAGQQLVRGNIRERMEVSIEDLRAAFPDSDGDGESEFEWFIEGRYTMFDRSGRPVRITSERRQAILESPVTSRVIIDIDAASGLQRLGGDILIHGSISEVNSLGEWEIRVAYDPSVLQFERGRKLGIFSPATVFFGEQAGGVVVISGSAPRGSGGISGEGEIFELQFTAIAAEVTVVEGQDAALSDTTGQEIEADFGNQADLSISGGGAAGVGRGQFDEKFR